MAMTKKQIIVELNNIANTAKGYNIKYDYAGLSKFDRKNISVIEAEIAKLKDMIKNEISYYWESHKAEQEQLKMEYQNMVTRIYSTEDLYINFIKNELEQILLEGWKVDYVSTSSFDIYKYDSNGEKISGCHVTGNFRRNFFTEESDIKLNFPTIGDFSYQNDKYIDFIKELAVIAGNTEKLESIKLLYDKYYTVNNNLAKQFHQIKSRMTWNND